MSALEKIACMQFRNDEVPNQELAKELVRKKDTKGIQEIAENLWNRDKNIANDCIKVMYEIGYIDPRLICRYSEDCIKLLQSKNNRMVWGAMIALSTVAELTADIVYKHLKEIQDTFQKGSVITQDAGTLVFARAAAVSNKYSTKLFPFLLNHLETCRSSSLPQYAEKTLVAVSSKNKSAFIKVLKRRLDLLTPPQLKRVDKVITLAEGK